MIIGSVTSKQNLGKLLNARSQLQCLKNYKLATRSEKNKDEGWQILPLIEHLKDEVREFITAENYLDQVQELADVSNMVDILLMAINEHQRLVQTGE